MKPLITILTIVGLFTFFLLPVYSIELSEPAWYYKSMGDRKLDEGNYGEAIVEYKKAIIKRIKEQESNNKSQKKELKGYPEANIALAKIYIKQKLYDMAMVHLDKAEQLKSLLQIKDQIFDVYYLKAEVYRLTKKRKKEIDMYKKIIGNDPNWNIRRRYSIGTFKSLMYLRNDNISRLKFGKAYFELGKIYLETGNYITAEPYLSMSFLYGYNTDLSFRYLKECYNKLNKKSIIESLENLK